jgi:hypothetical protein
MATENSNDLTLGSVKRDERIEKVRPTLFIGVGGTGMEVMLRIRRRILNGVWGTHSTRIESLTDFPAAQFLNFDLDAGTPVEAGKSQKQDPQHALTQFSEDERIVERLDIDKYSRDDDSLGRFPHIQSWFPLTPQRVRELNIDPAKGAGQIRGLSRLYFFDKYTKTRDQIRIKLNNLKNGLSKEPQTKRLGLELAQDKFKIVVICSVAGGTGSGSFLDMGWLAKWVGDKLSAVEVELVALLPTGFQDAGKDRTEANGYAALMELEAAMRGNADGQYLKQWDTYDRPKLALRPYDEVYLIDFGNLAQQHTGNRNDVYGMVADALFEDFASADFANRKRSIAVNQRLHKIVSLSPAVNVSRYGDMKLTYHKGYSTFGQSVLDTQRSAQREVRANVWAGEMLKAFFGVATGDPKANRATDKQRDTFMTERMLLGSLPFGDIPEFSSKHVSLKLSNGDFNDYLVVEDLLKDRNGNLVSAMQQKVDDRTEAILQGFKRDEWAAQIRDMLKQLERDAIRDQDATAEVAEDRVARQRKQLFATIKDQIELQLYAYLDNKEFGGLEYVLTLVEQIKDRLANPSTGLISQLRLNASRYQEIRDAIRTHEYERLMGNLAQAKGWLLGSGEKQSLVILDQLKVEISNFLKFHLRAKAAIEAAELMSDLSRWMGDKTGIDSQGRPTWSGLVGELQAGREAVVDMVSTLQQNIETLRQDLKKDHATYIYIKAEEREIPQPSPTLLREWADESFKDIGGSKVIFQMLEEPENRAALLSKVKHMAERQIALVADETATEGDPLLVALSQLTPVERQRRFTEWLARAMPWVDANLSRDFALNPDQYKCLIGVAGAAEFGKRFRAEIDAALPTHAGITSNQIGIVETGVPGRAVCYCELSGIPLTVLKGLEAWRSSYRQESERIPVHTHIDTTQFEHPVVPSPEELNGLADDFKQYLLAVMLGVMTRVPRKTQPPGQYCFLVGPGERLNVGNERYIRTSGLLPAWRDKIKERISERMEVLGSQQIAALSALAGYYEKRVYSPKKVQINEGGAEGYRKGFANTLAGELYRELRAQALRKGLSEKELERVSTAALNKLAGWTLAVEGSDEDTYAWEVSLDDDDNGAQLKQVVQRELFEEGSESLLLTALGLNSLAQPMAAAQAASVFPTGAIPAGMPPLDAPAVQYMLALNGAPTGPFGLAQVQQMLASGQVPVGTKVWRQGLPVWVLIEQFPEVHNRPFPDGMPTL